MRGLSAERARAALFLSLVFLGVAQAWPRSVPPPASCPCPVESADNSRRIAFADWGHRHLKGSRDPLAEAPAENWTVRVICRTGFESAAGRRLKADRQSVLPLDSVLRGPVRLLFGLPIDLRHADAETLMVLPGIGEVRARAILTLREEGRLNSVSDLLLVKGIGSKTLHGIASQVAIDYVDPCVSAKAQCALNGGSVVSPESREEIHSSRNSSKYGSTQERINTKERR